MITVETSPDTHIGVKNPVQFVLSTDNFITSAGTKASLVLSILSVQVDGAAFTLSIKGKIIEFVFKASPDTSGKQLPINTDPGYYAPLYVEDLLFPALSKCYDLRDYQFSIVSSDPDFCIFKIESKNIGVQYAIDQDDLSGSGSLSFIETNAGTDKVARENFKVYFDLFRESSLHADDFAVFKADLDGVPDLNNLIKFDISEYLKPLIGNPLPNNPESFVFALDNNLIRFYARYAEAYGDPITPQIYNATDTYYAFKGGRKLINTNINYSEYFVTGAPSKLLTQMPYGIEVTKNQNQYLNVWFNAGGTSSIDYNLFYELKVNYTDGTFSSHHIQELIVFDKKILTLQAGYSQLNIDSIKTVGKTVSSYEVVLYNESEDEYIMDWFKFNVSSKSFLNNRYFLFNNAFGQPETIWLTGTQAREIQLDKDIIRRDEVTIDDALVTGEFEEINNELRAMYKLSTGFKPKSYLEYFKDFLLSDNKFQQVNDQYHRLVLPAQKLKLDSDRDTTFSVEFNYLDAWIERGNA